MPFTGSHPAAVVPLLRTPLAGSALVIGSMAPDWPLFGLSPMSYSTTHSALGIVTADVVLGLVLYAVWHALVVPPAVALMPRVFRARLPVPRRRFSGFSVSSFRRICLVAVSLAVGSATHVGWDELTHSYGWGTRHIRVLRDSFHGVAGYQWAQYASGLLGVLIVLGCLARWWRRAIPRPVAETASAVASTSCALAVIVAAAIAAVAAAVPHLTDQGGANLHAGAYAAATRGGAAAAIAVLVVAVCWHITRITRAAVARHR